MFLMAALLSSLTPTVSAQESTEAYAGYEIDKSWDVTKPRGRTREIDFTTNEGTWMAVDISPDGTWILFDLLGHIYRVPADGGEAESLTQNSGVAINFHPRYSPDGEEIAFVSDRAGQMNLWVMDSDGSDPEPVFLDDHSRITEPVWTPDGRNIIATRNFGTVAGLWRRSARIWKFPRDGDGEEPVELVGEPSGTQAFWPSVTPDGQSVFYFYATFAAVTTGYGFDQHIRVLDLNSGSHRPVTPAIGPRSAKRVYHSPDPIEIAPEVSPDGRWLAFARRMPGGSVTYRGHTLDERTALWLKDLHSGAERVLMDPITADMATTHQMKNFSVIPRYAWAKDSESLVLSQGGKLRRVWAATGEVTTIPFSARVRRTISEQARADVEITDDPFQARFLRWMTASPDGQQLLFEAVGRLWVMDLPDGTPRPLTDFDGETREITPAWSPDGQWIAFTTWHDNDGGQLWRIPSAGGAAERLTEASAQYSFPEWRPDGTSILVHRQTNAVTGERVSGIVEVSASGDGSAEKLLFGDGAARLHFGPGDRLFFTRSRSTIRGRLQWSLEQGQPLGVNWQALVSRGPDGAERDELEFTYAQEVVLSPDGKRVAYIAGQNLFVAVVPPSDTDDGPVRIDVNDPQVPVTRISSEGAFSPRWRDADTIEFGNANNYHVHHLGTGKTDTVVVSLDVSRDIPNGTVALTGGRIVTLANREVIEQGTVVVEGSRIVCVGRCDTSGADRVFDVSGKTIVPGLVDTHAHHLCCDLAVPQHRAGSALYLAHGVTTVIDPFSGPSYAVAELTRAGKLVGPRAYMSGAATNATPPNPPSGGSVPRLKTYEDAENFVTGLANRGAVTVKQFLAPLRQQRQWLAEAARKNGLSVTAEGAEFYYIISMIMDGQTGWEHPIAIAPIYRDGAEFLGQAGAVYSNTLAVASGGPWAEEYYRSRSDLWNDPKHRRFVPWIFLAQSRDYSMRPLSGYRFPWLAESFADIVRAGGHGTLGGHGEQPGLDTHWELWGEALALSPMEALEVGSREGAYMIGLEDDIGSIETGKIADLLVLNSNPLEDIHNSTDILFVMKGGTLYEAGSLDEVWPDQTPYGRPPWVDEGALRTDEVPLDIFDRK